MFILIVKIERVFADINLQAAKTILEAKASVSSVGDLYVLPYAAEIGLKV